MLQAGPESQFAARSLLQDFQAALAAFAERPGVGVVTLLNRLCARNVVALRVKEGGGITRRHQRIEAGGLAVDVGARGLVACAHECLEAARSIAATARVDPACQ